MGLMGLLFKIGVECFNVLAWPLLALGYPLRASVQAIETNSIRDTQKLVTYWICFSLISLFEYAFAKLLQWFTSWPCIKLLIVGCLVIPQFEGSLYVYKHLVHPCRFVNQQTVLDWFIKLKEFYLLIKKKREAKGTGHDAATNLAAFGSLANFEPKLKETKVTMKESNATAIMEKKELTSIKQVTQIEPNFTLSGNRMCTSMGIKEMMAAKITGGNFLEILPSKRTSEDRTSDACQVSTTSEEDLMLGHNKQTSDIKTPVSAPQESREMITSEIKENPDKKYSKDVQKMWTCSICPVTTTSSRDYVLHIQGKQHMDAWEIRKPEEQIIKSKILSALAEVSPPPDSCCDLPEKLQSNSIQTPWDCAVCQVTVASKMDLISHFQGWKHENALIKLKAKIETSRNSHNMEKEMEASNLPRCKNGQIHWTCGICMVIIDHENSLVLHLLGRRHVNACAKAKSLLQTSKTDVSPASMEPKSNSSENTSLPENTAESTAKQQVKQESSSLPLATFEPELEEANVTKTGSNAAEIMEKKEGTSIKQVRQIESNFALSGDRMCTSMGIKEMMGAKLTAGHFLEVPPSKKISDDQTPGACQVTTTSEGDLMLGHNKQTSNIQTPASAPQESQQMVTSAIGEIPDKQYSKDVQKMQTCSICPETTTCPMDFVLHNRGKQHMDDWEKQKPEEQTLISKILSGLAEVSPPPDACYNLPENIQLNGIQTPMDCPVCKVAVTSKMDLISHFQGWQHEIVLLKLKVEIETSRNSHKMEKEMEASNLPRRKNVQIQWTCGICMVIIKDENSVVSHLLGRRHVNACAKAKSLIQTSKTDVSPASMEPKSNSSENTSSPGSTAESTAKQQVKQDTSSLPLATFEPKLEETKITMKESNDAAITEKKELTSIKQPKLEEAKPAKESNAAAIMETKEAISTKQVSQIEPDFALSGNRMCTSKGIKEMEVAKITGGDFVDILPCKVLSEDWTCDACQVITTTGEGNLMSGLNKQASEIKAPASAPLESREMVKSAVRDIPDKQHTEFVQKMWMCSVCLETATSVTDFVSHLQGKQHMDACEKQKLKEQMLKSKISPPPDACDLPEKLQSNSIILPLWSCAVCQVRVTSKMDLISHFQGRRHENALMQLKAEIETSRNSIFSDKMEKETEYHCKNVQIPWTCGICMVIIKDEASLVSHLQGKRHLSACDKAKCLKQTSVGQKSSSCGNASSPENTTGSTGKQQVKQVNMKSGFVEIRNSLWWCTICNISCNSEGDMNYHLNGSKHLSKTKAV